MRIRVEIEAVADGYEVKVYPLPRWRMFNNYHHPTLDSAIEEVKKHFAEHNRST